MKTGPRPARRTLTRAAILIGIPTACVLLFVLSPLPLTAANVVASVVLVVSLCTAFVMPRLLARRAGWLTALSFTMVVLGCVGLTIGMFSGLCVSWTPMCRREMGGWLSTWMALAPAAQGVLLTGRGMRIMMLWPRRLLRRR